MIILKFISVVVFIGSIAWFIKDPDFEPALAILGSLSALVSVLFIERRNVKDGQQNQSISNSSIGIQVGGDVNVENLWNGKHDE